MKKAILTIAVAAFAFAANAQFIIGGEIGFNTTGGSDNYEANSPATAFSVPNTATNSLTIAPVISYVINDKMQVGLEFDIITSSAKNYTFAAYAVDKEAWAKTSTSSFAIAPYFRYYFATAGNFSFFCQAQLGYGWSPRTKNSTFSNVTGTDVSTDAKGTTSMSAINLGITPGVNYRINEHFSADLFIDLAGLSFTHAATKNYGALTTSGWDDDFLVNTDVTNTFGFNANANAQTLNAHLGAFRLGFNYHF